jgi:hypothetical protein
MMIHGNRAYAHTRETFAPADMARSFGVAQSISYPRIFAAKPSRGIFATFRDLCLIAISWTFFIGLIIYPVGHLVGLATCAIALFILPAERR